MKRINPSTGLPFKRGDVREDGYVFQYYCLSRLKADGFFIEAWLSPEANTKHSQSSKISGKNWQKNNLDKYRKYNSRNRKANPDKNCAKTRRRELAKINRTPKWLTKDNHQDILLWYKRAKLIKQFTDEVWHVDHIVPLRGTTVSGLHVPWNLQLLPREINLSKGNKF